MTIHFGTPTSIKVIADAVPLYDSKEFESATRSTVPMLTLLMHDLETFNKIVGPLGFSGEYDLFLEYTVGPPMGRGKASHSDVMLKAGKHALAIEGKWTEPMYGNVAKWLKSGKDQANRQAVLEGWLSLLQQRTTKQLLAEEFNSAIYQMVHRAASAATADVPSMAYFLFKPSPDNQAAKPDDIFSQLGNLWNILGRPGAFPFHVVEIEIQPLDAYEPLRGLAKGEEATAEAVCAALLDSKPLFSFKSFKTRMVGGKP
jgi:hypothetical protein